MDRAVQRTFLALVLVQAAHSVEEYVFQLYEVFAPARFASSLVSSNLAFGFAVLNVSIFVFGMWCFFVLVRPGRPSAVSVVWGWVLIELGNGIGHSVIAIVRGTYFPGVATAPFLFLLAVTLAMQLSRAPRLSAPRGD